MSSRALSSALALCLAATACGGPPSLAPPSAKSTRRALDTSAPASPGAPVESRRELTADETLTAPSGASFQASKGWLVTTRDGLVALQSPEKDLTVTLVDSAETDPDAAITYAWKRVAPTFDRQPKQRTTPPPRDGWEAVTQMVYDTSATESRIIVALARRKGDRTHVALIDGSNAGVDRRGANLGTILSTWPSASSAASRPWRRSSRAWP